MIGAEISGLEEWKRELARLSAKTTLQGRAVLHRMAGDHVVNKHIPRTFGASGPGWRPVRRDGGSGKPLIDTGRLRDSIRYKANAEDLVVGSNLVYARIHNMGGTIKAKAGGYLAIPLSPPLTQSERRNAKPRDFKNTFVRPSTKAGTLIIYQRLGKGQIRAIFVLKRQVTINQRKYLWWSPQLLNEIRDLWKGWLTSDE